MPGWNATPKFGRSPQRPKTVKKPEKEREEKVARDAAKEAAKALGAGQPQLVPVGAKLGSEKGRVELRARGDNFLDEIPARGGSEHDSKPAGRKPSGERGRDRQRSQERGNGGRDGDEKKDRRRRQLGLNW